MGDNSEACAFCGGEIVFRTIRGVITPIHRGDSSCYGKRLYRRDAEGKPFKTECPKCHDSVFFLRHNGGSVWLDQLGIPWPKHPCFDVTTSNRNFERYLPKNAATLNGAVLFFVCILGRLSSGEGLVVMLSTDKKHFRSHPRYSLASSWDILCRPESEPALLAELETGLAIASRSQRKLITLGGSEFTIRHHVAKWST